MRQQPKKNLIKVPFTDKEQGYPRRVSYQKTITNKTPVIPKPIEYADIDLSFFNFIDKEISIAVAGKEIPTFTLYSSQRFSEYSQTWKHTDEEGNLLMNFKTVSRDNNPSAGNNQGGYWNIPGDRYYTILNRTVLDDSGREVYEIYSMKQPYAVDMSYRINFVTNIYENLNVFNEKLNDLFKSRQCYLRVNGHYLAMTLEEINDETQYGIEDQKFYTQSVIIKIMAYIIHKEDFKVERKPKAATIFYEGDKPKRIKPEISLEEYDDENMLEFGTIDVTVDFQEWNDKVEFTIDTDMIVEKIKKKNVRTCRVFVNDEPIYTEKGFKLKENDDVRIKIKPFEPETPCQIILQGYNPNKIFKRTEVPEFVSEYQVKHENITVI